jgi:membrane protein DedA with SNARE-associated domain
MISISIISGINPINLAVIFVFVFLSSFGFPGGLVAMISSGAIAGSFGNILVIMIIAAIAAILGDILAYELARKFSTRIKRRLQRYRFYIRGETRARSLMGKYEFFSVFITRFFLTGLCAITSYISGFEKLNRKKYFMAVVAGEILYAIIYTILGYIFRMAWNDLVNILNNIIIITILIAVAVVLVFIIYRIRKKKKGYVLDVAD